MRVFPKVIVLTTKSHFDVKKRYASIRGLVVRTIALGKTRISAIEKDFRAYTYVAKTLLWKAAYALLRLRTHAVVFTSVYYCLKLPRHRETMQNAWENVTVSTSAKDCLPLLRSLHVRVCTERFKVLLTLNLLFRVCNIWGVLDTIAIYLYN